MNTVYQRRPIPGLPPAPRMAEMRCRAGHRYWKHLGPKRIRAGHENCKKCRYRKERARPTGVVWWRYSEEAILRRVTFYTAEQMVTRTYRKEARR